MRQLLSLLIVLQLALGGGRACCLPDLSAADPDPAHAGCHEAGGERTPEAPNSGSSGDASGCGDCAHCLTRAAQPAHLIVTVLLPPPSLAMPALLPAGLPPFAPPLRPPIARAPAPPIV